MEKSSGNSRSILNRLRRILEVVGVRLDLWSSPCILEFVGFLVLLSLSSCEPDPGSLSRQNEEVLKKCAQEYLSRVKKEEQRYQALKVHAEEKLDR